MVVSISSSELFDPNMELRSSTQASCPLIEGVRYPLIHTNGELALSISKYRDASHVGALIMISKQICIRIGL